MSETEQNKTEEATPFKLKRGREKGAVARSADLGFFSTIIAFTIFALTAGPHVALTWTQTERELLRGASAPGNFQSLIPIALSMWTPLLLLGATIVVVVTFFEIVQLR